MTTSPESLDKLIDSLEERVKELNCLYEVEELLRESDFDINEILANIIKIIPPAFQFPEICYAKIVYKDEEFKTKNYQDSPWTLYTDIAVQDRSIGSIHICYDEEKPELDIGPFLLDEKRLLDSISTRISHYLMYQKLKTVFNRWESTKDTMGTRKSGEWKVILELLRRTDSDLFMRISRKMLNYLVWQGIEEASDLLQKFSPTLLIREDESRGEANYPTHKVQEGDLNELSTEIFKLAKHHLTNPQILSYIQKWIQEDKTSFLVRAIANSNSSLTDISEAIRRYYQLNPIGMELAPSTRIGVRASLIRRFFSDQLEFINIAKNYVRVLDFNYLFQSMIFPIGSHGKLGGKSAGMFLAYRMIQNSDYVPGLLEKIKIPKTWYISSDSMIHFMHHNNLDEILEQKYKSKEDIIREYPHVIQLFKNSHFPGDMIKGISVALDDFGDAPLVVRSSSLLEDRLGSAFSGKYKSLFVANQGSKHQRLEAVLDAIAEVYASTIGPDPIEYRIERGLIDFHEEMGIMIQEVVGKKVGDYFLPAFAGVAFSNNEFRWSPRIKKEDGLIRLVPGLGTRAVDRIGDDYPILISPGQPGLRANISNEDAIRYSPQKADVINLEKNRFETIDLRHLFSELGNEYPAVEKVTSIIEHGHLAKPGFNTDFNKEDLAVTFEGLFNNTPFLTEMNVLIKELQNKLATPVDIEFAHDGENLFLLQCRPQSYSRQSAPANIPASIPKEHYIFSAEKYVSNGIVEDIEYIVYVVPEQYSEIEDLDVLRNVGLAVGKLNKILPKGRFILMGPGRWGSRGDIKLGVNVTYSDINNTAVLIEIARKKGNYIPDLSFGTHFFQDLVEANIKYLPLYPDDKGTVFNEVFLKNSPDEFTQLLPEFESLHKVIRLIHIPAVSRGLTMSILMNADLNKAAALLIPPGSGSIKHFSNDDHSTVKTEDHGQWRMQMALKIATQLEPSRFGVLAMYVLGSTGASTAQAGSDIDLLVHFTGSEQQRTDLNNWLEGWSLCLDELNYIRTGYKSNGILDIHFIEDRSSLSVNEIADRFDMLNPDGIKKLPLAHESTT